MTGVRKYLEQECQGPQHAYATAIYPDNTLIFMERIKFEYFKSTIGKVNAGFCQFLNHTKINGILY